MEEKETIVKLYKEYISDKIIPTNDCFKVSKRFSREIESFSERLSEKENEELNKIYDTMMDIVEKETEQAFTEGYCLGVKMTTEALYCKKNNKTQKD